MAAWLWGIFSSGSKPLQRSPGQANTIGPSGHIRWYLPLTAAIGSVNFFVAARAAPPHPHKLLIPAFPPVWAIFFTFSHWSRFAMPLLNMEYFFMTAAEFFLCVPSSQSVGNIVGTASSQYRA
ncbi:hypothetical protein [uncultured Desulfovibrio sp.]|uniref:hypothetical protein n=1 Tax=uncultured Desulfovibrio sp. TaxID=167968 RepID=UPI002868F3F5|nr:hypothetical protein [uncultured Desulfovibrio sp.]